MKTKKNNKLLYPRQRLQKTIKKIAEENSDMLEKESFNFSPQKIIKKDLVFDIYKTKEKQIIEKIIEGLPKDNNEFYIEHQPDTSVFTLRKEN